MRSALELTLDTMPSPIREFHGALSKNDPEYTRAEYVAWISRSQGNVRIITGEASEELFERNDFIAAIDSVLSRDEESNLYLAFHRLASKQAAVLSLEQSNTKLMNLKNKFCERVHIWWTPIRPGQHYAIISDGKEAILEEPNHKGNAPFWATPVYDEQMAKGWAERFDKFIDSCGEELNFAGGPPN